MTTDADIVARKFLFGLIEQILAGRTRSDDEDDRSIDCSHDPIFGLCHDLSIVADHCDDLAPFRAMDRDRARHVVEMIVRNLGHQVDPWADPLRVDDGEGHFVSYRCGWCGIGGVKLWRGVHGSYVGKIQDACHMRVELLCRTCVEFWKAEEIAEYEQYTKHGMFSDQLGGMLPAVPAPPDTYWGYTSVEIRVQWWDSLPDYDPVLIAAKISRSPKLARLLLRCCRQRDQFFSWDDQAELLCVLFDLRCVQPAHCDGTSFSVPTPTGFAVMTLIEADVFGRPDEDLIQQGVP